MHLAGCRSRGAAWHRGSLNTQIRIFWDGIKQFGIFNTLDLVEKKIQKLIETLKSKTVLCLSQNGPPLDFKMFFSFNLLRVIFCIWQVRSEV